MAWDWRAGLLADERRRARQLGEAEVEDLDSAVLPDEDIVGLEVAVTIPLS